MIFAIILVVVGATMLFISIIVGVREVKTAQKKERAVFSSTIFNVLFAMAIGLLIEHVGIALYLLLAPTS